MSEFPFLGRRSWAHVAKILEDSYELILVVDHFIGELGEIEGSFVVF